MMNQLLLPCVSMVIMVPTSVSSRSVSQMSGQQCGSSPLSRRKIMRILGDKESLKGTVGILQIYSFAPPP